MSALAESHVEEAAMAWLAELGFAVASGLEIGPDGAQPGRAAYGDVVLVGRLKAAIARLNPALPEEARVTVLAKLLQAETPSLIDENRRLRRYLVEGVPVEVRRADGTIGGEQARLLDFEDPAANDWLAVNQVTVIENKANRRADVVVYVNGLPLGVVELEEAGGRERYARWRLQPVADLQGADPLAVSHQSRAGGVGRAGGAGRFPNRGPRTLHVLAHGDWGRPGAEGLARRP
jgi:type I site-specific restriction-modification system R (restriction) subunit